jgi:hypothetical protein
MVRQNMASRRNRVSKIVWRRPSLFRPRHQLVPPFRLRIRYIYGCLVFPDLFLVDQRRFIVPIVLDLGKSALSVSFGNQFFFWFHVNKNLCYLRQCSENFVFDVVR